MVGRGVADLYGWKLGDTVPLKSAIWRREDGSETWDVTVRAIYDLPDGGDTRQIVMHQDYFDEAKLQAKGLIGWYVIKVDSVDHAQAVGRAIDLHVRELAGRDEDVVGAGDGAVVREPDRQHRCDPLGHRRRGVLHDADRDGEHDRAVGPRTHQRARRAQDAGFQQSAA